jgi:hypothetical protein
MLLFVLGLNKKDAVNGRIMFNNYMGKGFVALRKEKKRFGRTKSPCFTQYHFGLTSIYFERKHPKRLLGNTFGY